MINGWKIEFMDLFAKKGENLVFRNIDQVFQPKWTDIINTVDEEPVSRSISSLSSLSYTN